MVEQPTSACISGTKEGRLEQEASFGCRLQQRRKALDLTQVQLVGQVSSAVDTIRKLKEVNQA